MGSTSDESQIVMKSTAEVIVGKQFIHIPSTCCTYKYLETFTKESMMEAQKCSLLLWRKWEQRTHPTCCWFTDLQFFLCIVKCQQIYTRRSKKGMRYLCTTKTLEDGGSNLSLDLFATSNLETHWKDHV